MGKYKENPRYNIISVRICDQSYFGIIENLDGRSLSEYLLAAVEEKLIRDRQSDLDNHLRGVGL